MGLVTQIGHSDTTTDLSGLISQLEGSHIRLSTPFVDVHRLQDEHVPAPAYQSMLSLFQSIATSSFHIIDNQDGLITADLGLQILYAMSKKRPVLFVQNPHFDENVDLFTRDIITRNTPKFYIIDIEHLSTQEIESITTQLTSETQYDFHAEELPTIKYRVRQYFRILLDI